MKPKLAIFLLPLLMYSTLQAADLWSDLVSVHPQFREMPIDQLPHCGFHVLMEAYRAPSQELSEALARFKRGMDETIFDTHVSPSGHFTIHYEQTGPNAIPTDDRDLNGIPDYLEFVANAFDRAWQTEVDTMGFKPPPDINGQPRTTYDIYCKNLSGQDLYGSTIFYLDDEIAALPGNNYPSFIEISTDFSFVNYVGVTDPIVRDSMAIAVTAAHEFNHALQLGYNIWNGSTSSGGFDPIDLWYIENSATYMEEVVADEVNDYYSYLPSFFSSADRGIIAEFPPLRIYGEVILNIMMGELYGKTITREVWEEIVNQPALPSLNKVLQRKGSDLEREIHRLAEWMFFCGEHYSIPGEFFPEAAYYPTANMESADDFASGLQKIAEGELPPLSFEYVKAAIATDNNLNIYLIPESTSESWSGAYFSFLAPFSHGFPAKVYSQISSQSIQANEDTLFSVVVAGNWNNGQIDSRIEYSLVLREFAGSMESDVVVYPNLIKPGQDVEQISFANVPADARIEIFSSRGSHIATLRPRLATDTVFWNLRTTGGDLVGSGVYIYRMVSSGSTQKGKIVVVR